MNSEKISALYAKYNTQANEAVKHNRLEQEYVQAHNYLLEAIASSDGESLKSFLQTEIEKDFLLVPGWLRMVCMKIIILEMSQDVETLKWCYYDLSAFYPAEEHEMLLDLKNRITRIDSSFKQKT